MKVEDIQNDSELKHDKIRQLAEKYKVPTP